jgi:hypothetical protein
MQSIVVTIENGKAVVQTTGFVGGACLKETADLKAALGVVERETPTAEMHQQATVAQRATR